MHTCAIEYEDGFGQNNEQKATRFAEHFQPKSVDHTESLHQVSVQEVLELPFVTLAGLNKRSKPILNGRRLLDLT